MGDSHRRAGLYVPEMLRQEHLKRCIRIIIDHGGQLTSTPIIRLDRMEYTHQIVDQQTLHAHVVLDQAPCASLAAERL